MEYMSSEESAYEDEEDPITGEVTQKLKGYLTKKLSWERTALTNLKSKLDRAPGFANFIDEWSHCDFCFTNFGVILEYLESSTTTKKAIFRLSSTRSWHVYTIVRDTRSSCGGPLT